MSNVIETNIAVARRERALRNLSAAKRKIWVTFRRAGVHCYPAALNDPSLSDVSFLGYPHRHTFHFRVSIEVTHNDRSIEFFQFQRWLESLYTEDTLALDSKSCEMMIEELYLQIAIKYPDRDVSIEISEDGENGAYYEFTKE